MIFNKIGHNYCLCLFALCVLSAEDSVIGQSQPPDLCQIEHIDSITWVSNARMYFITSRGYYWYIKENDMPPKKGSGTKLPNGFKIGEAAVYKNTLAGCGSASKIKGQQEIVVTELTPEGQKFMAYDIRTHTWSDPENYNLDHILGQAAIDYTQPIDGIIAFAKNEFYMIQGLKYNGLNYELVCQDPEDFPKRYGTGDVADLQTRLKIDAAMLKGERDLYVFQGDKYYILQLDLTRSGGGKLYGIKGNAKSLKSFLGFTESCGIAPKPQPQPHPQPHPQPGVDESEAKKEEDQNNSLIIICIVLVVVVVIAAGALALFATLKKPKNPTMRSQSQMSGVSVSPTMVGGRSPSKTSVRSDISALRR